jgi:hypothetical protein
MNPTYVEENTAQRLRLIALTARLTEAQLQRETGRGWTVAAKLVHLAFWDEYCLALITRWEREGVRSLPTEVDAVNEAVRTLAAGIPADRVVPLVRAAAEAIDHKVEDLAAELEAAVEAAGRVRLLRRSEHRRAHLDQIEAALER